MDPITLMLLAQAHWSELTVIALAATGIYGAVQKRAYLEAGKLALVLVEKVALAELGNVDKRKFVVDATYSLLPIWAKKLVTQEGLEAVAENAYQLLKGQLAQNAEDITKVNN